MSNGGGWTVFQRRQDGSVDFYRTWDSYKTGFPDTATGELWLGNEKLYHMTNQKSYKMRIDLVNRDGVSYNLNYDAFRISNEANNYRLETLGSCTGNTGYDYMAYHRGRDFTTHDDDNDAISYNCAVSHHGAWWYNHCHRSNLNGDYSSSSDTGVALYNYDTSSYTEYSLRFTEMKIRPV
uniref:Tenascin n=1 Tax=Stichopus japonicus TaxID=307972 RepID=A0A075X7G0_STIJA|nr:tenascin [Apostichopus japonicus]